MFLEGFDIPLVGLKNILVFALFSLESLFLNFFHSDIIFGILAAEQIFSFDLFLKLGLFVWAGLNSKLDLKQLNFSAFFRDFSLKVKHGVTLVTEINTQNRWVYFIRTHTHFFSQRDSILDLIPKAELKRKLIFVLTETFWNLVYYDGKISCFHCLRIILI